MWITLFAHDKLLVSCLAIFLDFELKDKNQILVTVFVLGVHSQRLLHSIFALLAQCLALSWFSKILIECNSSFITLLIQFEVTFPLPLGADTVHCCFIVSLHSTDPLPFIRIDERLANFFS